MIYVLPANSEYTTSGYVNELILNTLPIRQQSKILRQSNIILFNTLTD
jgi:hypothetical protein